MSDQVPDPMGSVIQLLSTLGVGAAALKIIERIFTRRDRHDDEATSIRKELREQVALLQTRLDAMEGRYDTEREQNAILFADKETLRAENHRLRSEAHDLRSFLAQLVLHAQRLHRELKLPDAEMPRVPAWLNASTPGPTTGDS